MEVANQYGCTFCYNVVHTDIKRLNSISVNKEYQEILYQCPNCNAYWGKNKNKLRIISPLYAEKKYEKLNKKKNSCLKILFVILYLVGFYVIWAMLTPYKGLGLILPIALYLWEKRMK